MNPSDEIWVTGLGLVTPFGAGGRKEGAAIPRTASDPRSLPLPGSSLPVRDFDKHAHLGQKGLRLLTPGTLYFMAASQLALRDAGLDTSAHSPHSCRGIVSGTLTANAGLVAQFDRTALRDGPAAVNPALFAQTVWNGTSSQCAIRFGLSGLNMTVSTGPNSGVDALIVALRQLQDGAAHILLAGGYEEITPFFTGLFHLDDRSSAPLFFSEGASVLVMEKAASARERAAEPLAVVRAGRSGFIPGASATAYAEFRDGLIRAACHDAGIASNNLTLDRIWWVHGPMQQSTALSAPDHLAKDRSPACSHVVVDVVTAYGCSGGLAGALAAACAVTDDRHDAAEVQCPSGTPTFETRHLILAEDGLGRVAVLLLDLP